MSSQFYNYISELLNDYFSRNGVKPGDRFYLQLDKESEVSQLIQTLRQIEGTQPFPWRHKLGEEFRTFYIPFQSVKLVVANTSEDVTPDFLVTLRNQAGEQKDDWKNTALISIVSEQLDSIQGGSSDLQKEGMPLHPSSLFNNLKSRIEKSDLQKVEKIILLDNLDNLLREQQYQQITFFEFEDIFTTLQKGSIDDTEYYKFGLFKDPDLESFKGKEQKERLNKNRELFEFVRKVHDFGLGQEELEKRFVQDGARELAGENWKEQSYTKVQRAIIKADHDKVEFFSTTVVDKLLYWDKPNKETAAGKRKRHIVVFNPDGNEQVQLQFGFNLMGNIKSLSKEYLKPFKSNPKDIGIDVKTKNISVSMNAKKTEPTFIKFAYRHENKATMGAEFLIAVLPIEPIFLDKYKSVYFVDPDKSVIEIQYDDNNLIFNNRVDQKKVEIKEQNETVSVSQDEQLIVTPLPEAFNDDDELAFKIKLDDVTIPLLLKNELQESMPITGQRLWKLIRETGKDVLWIKENKRLVLENREFYFHSEYREFFEWESEWIDIGLKSARFESGILQSEDIKLNDDLREAYSRFLTYFSIRNSIPSLCSVTVEMRERALEYIHQYQKEIKNFKNGTPAGSKGIDLFKLGTIQSNDTFYITPFHPLMVAYKLKLYELLDSEELDNSILNRLNADSLIPFLYDERALYKPEHQKAAMEWLTFKPVNTISVSDANQYLAKVVSDKISQFKEHFSYLFIEKSKAPLQLNVINISNDIEVLRGILQWMLKEIEKTGKENVKPVEVTLYKEENTESSFDLFARTDTVDEFENLFDIKLKVKDIDSEDLLRTIREKLFFYKQDPNASYRYAHISFYKMHAQEHHAVQPMDDMTSGIAIEGLYSSVPSMKDEETYKSGFGTKTYRIDEKNYLTSTAFYVNELAANLRNEGNDSYRKGEAILSRTTTADEKTLEKVFKSSYWVTFVDPTVDLEFFNKYDGNLVVIHYSDQYSSSSRYDAITVTDKSQQYYAVIKEFLHQKEVEGTDEHVLNTIKAFNTFNGEWLLRIIGSKGHFDREKLSILSAIKYSVSYFDHPDITWVPISLEEILRVAGAVSLSRSDGIFTAKNLGVKGSHSDDLLLIGLENKDGHIAVHFYPVEVKIGFNRGEVLDKARNQVQKTKKLLIDTLTGEMGDTFTGRFYRNFFAQLLISNAQKLEQSGFWSDKPYNLTGEIIEKLLKDDFNVSNELTQYIGDGAILSFQKDATHRSAALDENVLILNLTEHDGYDGLVKPIKQMWQWIQHQDNDFIKEDMLSYKYKGGSIPEEPEPKALITGDELEPYVVGKGEQENEDHPLLQNDEMNEEPQDAQAAKEEKDKNPIPANEEVKIENDEEIEKEDPHDTEEANDEFVEISVPDKPPLEELRIRIGRAENSAREIYWEYGNKGLANRHLLISGKSGQGKTYFMQCLLLEKSKLGLPSIVIDYTEGFLPNQLEPEFVEFLGEKLKQKIVYSEKLPINPFQKNVRDIGGIQLPESNTDVAERIKSVFASVYKSLGIQQQNSIYEAVLNGLDQHDDQMTLLKLKELLDEDGSTYAKTALSQIRPLIDRNPFSTENAINWKDIVESNGEVHIIQLTGFPRDVQLMITEFILWDLWNYSVRYGNKNKPMPVIMDEAQNLDHTEKSPSARILTEGRKFGWSAWYATQFLKSQLGADELARLQNSSEKVYFSPPEQELSNIAASLTKDNQEKKYWENKLATLKKGQCIVHAPIRKENGELSNPSVTVVDIIPLSERI
ncbi:DNA phosphorothioation-dependent restriction protein DptH [Peribacillus deserti]|uniref:DNA phosphorothioation-dependent restriction protein DptH n=1 Tax=Peribacillus deserti TaxID=673318 RepID=A0ABS2QF79_9BACI|nr:DNA phosphorothioation-dependent restriction protein DptH [Peribacillus deserti]MBM7691630.1 DNA phosphorothioation-dependent restriction protein DptH [Peribacillus deserti]